MNNPLEHRLSLARAALAAAEKNALDLTKNPVYWKTQVEREQKLIETLEAELREAELGAVENPANPAS